MFNPFSSLKNIKSINNRYTAYKILNKIVYSNNRLNLMGIKETDKCKLCKLTETTKHLLYDCEHTRKLWKILELQTEEITGLKMNIDFETIICGTKNKYLNSIISHFKSIILRRKITLVSSTIVKSELKFLTDNDKIIASNCIDSNN